MFTFETISQRRKGTHSRPRECLGVAADMRFRGNFCVFVYLPFLRGVND